MLLGDLAFLFFFFFSCSTRFMGMLIKLNETFMFVKNRGGHMHSLLFAISGGFVNTFIGVQL